MEERDRQPLGRRVVRRLKGPAYERYPDHKSRALAAFDTAARKKDTFGILLPKIPVIRVGSAGLRDRVLKYKALNET
jgi:hypothetical protein